MADQEPLRTTRFSDICGSLDEIKRSLREDAAPDPQALVALIEDIRYMFGRMDRRLREYARFEQEAEAILAQWRTVGPSNQESALAIASQLAESLRHPPTEREAVEALCAQAEEIRSVANALEQKLRRCRDAALALYHLYRRVRGERDWSQEECTSAPGAGTEAELADRLAEWLPPPPHRERILQFLARGRAHLLPASEPGGAPVVEFEDGGVMALPDVRWSDGVENFYPAGHEPHPDGLRHRDR